MQRHSVRWLDVVQHRVPGVRAPYLLVLQHHDIPASSLLAAPVTLPITGDTDILTPRLIIEGRPHRIRMLDISAVPRTMIEHTIISAAEEADVIMAALDIILHGYPVGRPY